LENCNLGITKEKYFEICEVTNSEVEPDKIPIDFSDLLIDTQVAMAIVQMLPDKWDGASGSYQGKDLSILPFLVEVYEIENKLDIVSLITIIINKSSVITNDKINRQAKHGK